MYLCSKPENLTFSVFFPFRLRIWAASVRIPRLLSQNIFLNPSYAFPLKKISLSQPSPSCHPELTSSSKPCCCCFTWQRSFQPGTVRCSRHCVEPRDPFTRCAGWSSGPVARTISRISRNEINMTLSLDSGTRFLSWALADSDSSAKDPWLITDDDSGLILVASSLDGSDTEDMD